MIWALVQRFSHWISFWRLARASSVRSTVSWAKNTSASGFCLFSSSSVVLAKISSSVGVAGLAAGGGGGGGGGVAGLLVSAGGAVAGAGGVSGCFFAHAPAVSATARIKAAPEAKRLIYSLLRTGPDGRTIESELGVRFRQAVNLHDVHGFTPCCAGG